MNFEIFKASERGHANHGWLKTYHTFSFADYFNPNRMNFGALRVLNDDEVVGGMGFPKHSHNNMEIISIPLEGKLEHDDSMGNKTIIAKGEVQLMSAGNGIYHAEKNHSQNDAVKFLQIWILPLKRHIDAKYDQKVFDAKDRKNKFQTIVSPRNVKDEGVKINQYAWFSLIDLDLNKTATYELKDNESGVFVFVLEGSVTINSTQLKRRDGYGIWDTENFIIEASENSELLLMEVPLNIE
jgi:quercetin 2,3-dioxygenase